MKDKEKLLKDHARMCMDLDCGSCPIGEECGLHCNKWMMEHTKEAVEIIEKWATEHPVKTRQGEFLKLHPNAMLDNNGALCIFPCEIDCSLENNSENCARKTAYGCSKCRYDYWSQEVADE